MTIDDRFKILISFKVRSKPAERFSIAASQFFDFHVEAEYSPVDWGCDLPWRNSTMADYLPSTTAGHNFIEFICVDIIDLLNAEHRRLLEQRWGNNKIIFDWSNLNSGKNESNDQLIIDISEKNHKLNQIIKIDLFSNFFKIIHHAIYSSDSKKEYIKWLDVPELDTREI